MFEKADPSAFASAHRVASSKSNDEALHIYAADASGDDADPQALRAIGWGELTARFNAARDFRMLLSKDRNAKLGLAECAGESGCDVHFAEAAARFFRANDEDQRGVNHKGLEHRKTSSVMYSNVTDTPKTQIPQAEPTPTAHCAPGVAREK